MAPIGELLPLEQDIIDNIRIFRITEMVYQKGEFSLDKFTTIFNTLSTYNASVFIIIDSDGKTNNIYFGVRNNEEDDLCKRSSVTLGDTLKTALIGHFPGARINSENRKKIADLSQRIRSQKNVSSVSVVGNLKSDKEQDNEKFVQGLEKLIYAMSERQYIGIIIAENQSSQSIELIRKNYQDLYTKLSPYQKIQFSDNFSSSSSKSKSFFEMNGKQKASVIGGAAIGLVGAIGGALIGGTEGLMLGGQIAGQLNGFVNTLAPSIQDSETKGQSQSSTVENKAISDMLHLIDEEIKRTDEFDSYGLWNVAGYFLSDDMASTEIAASNYRSLMNGEKSGHEVSAINSWRLNDNSLLGDFNDLTTYVSRFVHPKFCYGDNEENIVVIDATTAISGKELGLHLGLPRETVPGLQVIQHAEFGKEVNKYKLFSKNDEIRPEDWMTLGRVFDLGKITNKMVQLDNKSLNMHTFITGSTGSGKSNTVYQMLAELYQDKIPFLVIEPAKGEYKDVFGNYPDVNVFSTNPNIAELINLNPFMFPESIHVLEHVDGLVEIFSVCWPMYDAMPAFFKDAILKSYESVGWDLGSSTYYGKVKEYPDFDTIAEKLDELIGMSDYASDIKSNYRGALITRVKSLTVGLNKFIFTHDQTPYAKLFDENCILDISRVKSSETKALLMGLMVYILNEYRVDKKTESNNGLKHITVLEEAHNLLKNSKDSSGSELIGKSVEMLTQTIAEIRTYGEGFIIVDQSPSSVDIAAIKNTNTKIVLRTPEANDRDAIGRSIGLTNDQVNEIAKLPSGVAVVYQNDWISPILTLINKANIKESIYIPETKTIIRPLKAARLNLLKMLLEPWIKGNRIPQSVLDDSLKVVDISKNTRNGLINYIDKYSMFNGHLLLREEDKKNIQLYTQEILGISDKELLGVNNVIELEKLIGSRINKTSKEVLKTICMALTMPKEGETNHD